MDVNIYSSSVKQSTALIGNHENTEVGNFLRDYLDLDLEPVTKELQAKTKTFKMLGDNGVELNWLGEPRPEKLEPDHYHGDFKRSLECEYEH